MNNNTISDNSDFAFLILPSITIQPAIEPTLEILNISLISAVLTLLPSFLEQAFLPLHLSNHQ
jgi:hypothetical protein